MKYNATSLLRNIGRTACRAVLFCAAVFAASPAADAFPATKYATSSRLSSGHWVKVSVAESGLYALTPDMLRRWGFTDISRVRVFGYGGQRIADTMTASAYVDDLPAIPTFNTPGGSIVFYGAGPETWSVSGTNRYVQSPNVYTSNGYYFITQIDADADTIPVPEVTVTGRPGGTKPTTTYWHRLQHEQELASPGQAGPQLVGEDFRLTPTRTFTFNLPGLVTEDSPGVWFEVSFVAKTFTQSSLLTFTANGQTVEAASNDRVSATVNDEHYHGTETITRHTLADFTDNRLELKITHTSPVTVHGAWLNYIAVNYMRQLDIDKSGYLTFWSNSSSLSLGNADKDAIILDVTTPTEIQTVDAAEPVDNRRVWSTSHTGYRTYVAFNPDATLPAPTFCGTVANQDIHAELADGDIPDMIIICTQATMAQAQRIAELHARDTVDPLKVNIYDAEKVYNEFSSGMADPSGIRKLFKMAWDLGQDTAPQGYKSKFRYAILIGRATYDNRMLTDAARSFNTNTLPNWAGGNMRQSLNDTDGYNTDDFLAMLKDGSGGNKGLDDLEIAIGRIPATGAKDAALYVDKLEQYMFTAKQTGWKLSTMFLADDADSGRHMEQTEAQIANMTKIADNPLMVNKVYIDAYIRESGTYPMARQAMFKLLDEGVVWWNYIGHANEHTLTHNGQLTFTDINSLLYKNFPVFYGATCDFLRWDQNTLSGGELMLFERYGGAISVISATRPVYIYENGLLNSAVGRHLGARDESGRLLTVGEIYRRSKNNILTAAGEHLSNPNRLKFVLMGDPAMRLTTPSDIAVVDDIDGKPLVDLDSDETPLELHALQNATVNGRICTPDGSTRDDFNGIVTVTLYDAEYSTTTNGNDDNNTEGKQVTFEQQGGRLTAVSAPVTAGRFTAKISVPVDIADNYRPAAISLYAYSTDNSTDEAAGKTNNLYVCGFDESALPDTIPPTIDRIFLNHESFVDGDRVNTSPMLIAQVSDNVAINLSSAGIGHAMTVCIDGNKSFNDVSTFYTPAADGTASGTINYPLDDLTAGEHTLTLRIWDTSANAQTADIRFTVDERIAPKIFDIYSDANPATDRANFYITHNRPEQMVSVTVSIYNLLGRPIWSSTVDGQSDMFTSSPVTWDLTDSSGSRVPRGIYLYRATITTDNETFDTGSRRIAVTAN